MIIYGLYVRGRSRVYKTEQLVGLFMLREDAEAEMKRYLEGGIAYAHISELTLK